MSGADDRQREALWQLLADRATEGLDAAGDARLEALLGETGAVDDGALERAATAVDLALISRAGVGLEPLPSDLARRIAAQASTHLPRRRSEHPAGPRATVPPARPSASHGPRARPRLGLVASVGWLAAAAAGIALVVVWNDSRARLAVEAARVATLDARLTSATEALEAERRAAAALDAALADERRRSAAVAAERERAEERRAELVARLDASVEREVQLEDRLADLEQLLDEPPPEVALAELLANPPADLVRVPWSTTGDPLVADGGVAGEVVWSDSLQQGFMIFDGMPVNRAAEAQYQLWIFSADQKEATPVDGGVFDAPASDRLVIPIDAKLGVRDPSLFAVTLEKPGGVVVSDRERLLLAAPL